MIEKESDRLENEETVRRETLRSIYPIFKQEVYNRRGAMMQIARSGMLSFVSLSVLAALLSGGRLIHPALKGLASVGVGLVTLLLIHQIRQEKSRHERAKRQLILLEQQLQFFEPGAYIENAPLYPTEWQERPAIDKGLVLAIIGLLATALLLISTILLA
ncbi:MAG: hypothetical protein EPO39_09070 [Candidatus Manganitrophaceae bacterium]|nr:MAG: hypothetical protein EPO39_09070 [Candidatus Manganitrophaceae bacterium]